MLVIRNAQFRTFRQRAQGQFEHEMLAHLRAVSPRVRAIPLDDPLAKMIHEGIGCAHAHGFTLRGPVRLFLELMTLFGSEFHSDPQYEWASTTLANASRDSETRVARRLYEHAKHYQSRVFGPHHAYLNGALRRIRHLAQPNAIAIETLTSRATEVLRRVYPEKANDLGEQHLRALLTGAVKDARKYHLPDVRGAVHLTCLQLVFGRGCANDPLHPWIGQALVDTEAGTLDAKLRRLEQAMLLGVQKEIAQGDLQA
jgi:hypothetical protein